MPKIKSLNVSILKDVLRWFEQDTRGNKTELVLRLEDYLQADEVEQSVLDEMARQSGNLQAQINDLKALVENLVTALQVRSEANTHTTNITEANNTNNLNNNGAPVCETVSISRDNQSPLVVSEAINNCDRTGNSHTVREIAETLPVFDPTDDTSVSVEQFVERVNASYEAYRWNSKSLLLAIYSRLKGVAKMWFDASEHFSTSWEDLQRMLLQEFSQTFDETEVHCKMTAAARKTGENIEEYCFRIAALGRRLKLSEQAIMKHTRDGLRHRELQAAIAAMRFTTLKDMREVCLQYLRNQPYNRMPLNRQVGDKSEKKEQEATDMRKPEKNQQTRAYEVKCYNCFETGHISTNCPKPQRRRRCVDCQKVHPKSEPADCGRKPLASRKVETNDEAFTKTVHINNEVCTAFIDTGSQCSMIGKSLAERLPYEREQCSLTIKGIGGGMHYATERMSVKVKLDEIEKVIILYIVEDPVVKTDLLLGQDMFDKQLKAVISNGKMIFQTAKTEIGNTLFDMIQHGDLDHDETEQLVNMLHDNRDCFATNLKEIGKTDLVTLKIEVDTDEPIAQNPYRVPLPKRPVVMEMIKELLEADIIQRSDSEYASPIILAGKKDGSVRFCIDYRRLNRHIKKKPFPMPNIEERLQDAKQYKLFTTLDLNSGYYQIPVAPESQKYTAFVTTEEVYEFKRMPFGLKNSPVAFNQLMAKLVDMVPPGYIIHYMDDILIGTNDIAEMFKKLEGVLAALRRAGLTLNPKKCVFFCQTISFLGHKLTIDGIEPGELKTAAIHKFPSPTSITEVRRFLGLSGYFRKFVPAYALITEPIRRLLQKDEPFVWGEQQEAAFNEIKSILTNSPVLTAFQVDANHQLHTDASAVGLAAVLLQETLDGWKPVAYYSRSTSKTETKMHSYELETLAVVEGLERFRYYVYGKEIKVVTDCSAVSFTWEKRELIPRIARWWLRVQEYDIVMEHRSETRMRHVDALSRKPVEKPNEIQPATLRVDRADVSEEDWLFAMQLQDDEIQSNVKRVQQGDKQAIKDYVVESGRLFKRQIDRKLWVVPRNLRYQVVQNMHEKGGHLSVERTIEQIQQLMWFPRMRNIVKSFLKSCVQCAYNKQPGGTIEGEYHFSEMEAVPFKMVHIDHLGPFPRSSKRNEHLFVIVDAFTKYVFMRAVPNTSTKQVLKVFDELSGFVGMPQVIVSDRGTAFTAKEFTKYCKENVIKHILTAVRTPRANGQVERFNRTILSSLLPLTERSNRWDEQLRFIQWSLNSSVNATTKRTPHELLFGFQPRDITANKIVLLLQDDAVTAADFNEKHQKLQQQREAAAERIEVTRQQAKLRYDRHHTTPTKYVSGQLVLVKNEAPSTGTSRKLEPRYKGPFIVKKVLGNDRYIVEDLPDSKRKRRHYTSVYASDTMKPWCTLPPDELQPEEDDIDEDIDG